MTFMARDLLMGSAGNGVAITDPNHPDLVAFYTMDNISGSTLVDETPNNHDGTMNNSPTSVAGKINNALRFDGVDQNVSVAPASTIGVSPTDGSIAFWFKTSEATVLHTPIAVRTANTTPTTSQTEHLLFILESSGQVRARSGGTDVFSVASGFNDGAWHFVVVNKDSGNTLELFIASVSDNSTSISAIASGHNIGITLGSNLNTNTSVFTQFYDGDLDQFRYFNRILTQDEIDTLYNAGAGA